MALARARLYPQGGRCVALPQYPWQHESFWCEGDAGSPGARRAVAANPGYYTLPSLYVKYPYGLKGTLATSTTLKKSLARDVVVLLGDQDIIRDDPDLRKTPEADAQGLTRYARGQYYIAQAQSAAEKLHAALHWRLADLAGSGQVPDLAEFNAEVYAQLFLTPGDDPWLGLVSSETYLALEPAG